MNTNAHHANTESNVPRWVRYTFGGLAALFLVPPLLMVAAIAVVALAPVAAIGLPFVWQGLVGFSMPHLAGSARPLRRARPLLDLEHSSPSWA